MRDDRWIRDAGMIYTMGYTYAWAKSLGILAGLVFLVYAIGFIALLLGAILLLIALVWLVKNRRRVWRFTKKLFIGLFKLVYWTVKLPVLAILFVLDLIITVIALPFIGAYYLYKRFA